MAIQSHRSNFLELTMVARMRPWVAGNFLQVCIKRFVEKLVLFRWRVTSFNVCLARLQR